MSAPSLFCRCSHPRIFHEEDEHKGECPVRACGCGKYRKAPGPVTPPTLQFIPREDDGRQAAG